MHKWCHFTLSTAQLWSWIILAGFGFYVSLVPLLPNDFWWHLKIGKIISQQRTIPQTNMFSWALPASAPFTYGAWLAELLFYLLYRLGDVALISCVRTVLALVAFGLIGIEAQRQARSWRFLYRSGYRGGRVSCWTQARRRWCCSGGCWRVISRG